MCVVNFTFMRGARIFDITVMIIRIYGKCNN